jgi:hypothetical protein
MEVLKFYPERVKLVTYMCLTGNNVVLTIHRSCDKIANHRENIHHSMHRMPLRFPLQLLH